MGESTQRAYGVRLKKFRKRKNGKDRPPVFSYSHGAAKQHGGLFKYSLLHFHYYSTWVQLLLFITHLTQFQVSTSGSILMSRVVHFLVDIHRVIGFLFPPWGCVPFSSPYMAAINERQKLSLQDYMGNIRKLEMVRLVLYNKKCNTMY